MDRYDSNDGFDAAEIYDLIMQDRETGRSVPW